MEQTLNMTKKSSLDRFRSALGRGLVVDRKFQLKYTSLVVASVLISMLPIGALTLYFLNQNYNIFMDLALSYSPNLLPHLERERIWINGLVGTTTIGMSIFFAFYGLRVTGRLVTPLLILKEQIKNLARGHWDTPQIRVRDTDEFHELVDAYQYFYKTLQHETKLEIEQLEKVLPDVTSEHSRAILREIIQDKTKRLGR
ncbi:MAG TPA: HAMP domain-containing protein, partial [Bdellovibrionales bacterium]|nr:HAMP domain-containing protein [Bdellovibrionales bacterium]